jgi:hypothetical protein
LINWPSQKTIAYYPVLVPTITDIRTIVEIKCEKEQKCRFVDRLTYIYINYLFICVLWRQMVNVVYRQATLHLNIFQFLFFFSWHLCIKHIEEVSTHSIGKLTIYQTDRVVGSFSTGGVTQENGKGYNKCVNTSQVERLMSKRRKRIDHHLVMTIAKSTDWLFNN